MSDTVLKLTLRYLQNYLHESETSYLFGEFWGSYFNESSLDGLHKTPCVVERDSARSLKNTHVFKQKYSPNNMIIYLDVILNS